MKYGIDIGHNLSVDGGAVGILSENKLTMAVGKLVVAKLRALGHEVVECLPHSAISENDSLNQRCRISNQAKCARFVSIHFNAFNKQAYGTEIFYMSDAGKKIAEPVLKKICELGFFNRGVKQHPWKVLAGTKAIAILIEVCFIDSKRDTDLFNAVGAESVATAIVSGLQAVK